MCLEWPDAFLSQKIETLIIAVRLRWFRRFVVKPKTVAILHSNLLYHKRALFMPYSEINCGIIMNLLSHILAFVCILFYIDTWWWPSINRKEYPVIFLCGLIFLFFHQETNLINIYSQSTNVENQMLYYISCIHMFCWVLQNLAVFFYMEIMFIYIIFLLLLNNSAIIMPVAAIFWL